MESQRDYLGEEEYAKQQRQKNDQLSAGAGGGAFLITLIIETSLSKVATEFMDKLSATVGNIRAWIIAAIIGVATFCVLKIYMFFRACCRDTVFSKGHCLKITVRHYIRISRMHPYLLLSIACYTSIVAVFFWVLSKQNGKHFPADIFIITAILLNLLVIFLYNGILHFARTSQCDLGQVLLKKTHPGIKWEKAEALNPNKLINEKLLALKNVDLICVAAIHSSHLMRDPECLKTIRANNPQADIYYMPQFPYSWHILERAAELEYSYRKGYRGPLIHAIFNACKHLKANVMVRHNPAEFRLTIWAKFIHGEKNILSPKSDDLCKIQPSNIECGGFFTQQYVHGQEGYEGPYLNVSQEEWCGALICLIRWFFDNWKNNCSPISFADLIKEEQYMLRVAKSIGLSQHKINNLRGTGGLASYLQENDVLKEFYLGIEQGDL